MGWFIVLSLALLNYICLSIDHRDEDEGSK